MRQSWAFPPFPPLPRHTGCTYTSPAEQLTAGGNGLPVISTAITINGNGATIAGNNSDFRIFLIGGAPGESLTLNRLTVTGGTGVPAAE